MIATGLTGSIDLGRHSDPTSRSQPPRSELTAASRQTILSIIHQIHRFDPWLRPGRAARRRPIRDVRVFGPTILGSALGLPVDPVAFAIVVSAFVHGEVLDYDPVGTPANGWSDMSPYCGDETQTRSARPAVESFLPYRSAWINPLLGLGVGLFCGYIAYRTVSPFYDVTYWPACTEGFLPNDVVCQRTNTGREPVLRISVAGVAFQLLRFIVLR